MYFQGSGNTLSFRLTVPARLRDVVGQREIKCNIPAADRRAAEELAEELTDKLKTLFTEIDRGKLRVESLDIPALVREYIKDGLDRLKQWQETGPRMTPGQFDDNQTSLELLRADIAEAFAYRDRRKVEPVVDAFLRAKGIDLNKDSLEYLRLCIGILKASVQLLDVELNSFKIDPLRQSRLNDKEPEHTVAPPQMVPQPVPQVGHRLEDVINEYWAEHEAEWAPRSVAAYQTYREKILEVLGPDTLVQCINHEKARKLKRAVSGKAPGTLNGYLTFAGAVMRYGIRNGMVTLNPFEGLKVKRKTAAHEEQSPFDMDELQRLFNHPGYAEFEQAHQFWIPLLGAWTGCRVEELSQLYVDQVIQVDDLWCLRISPDHPDQRLKNKASVRVVPLHPVLRELGFIDYVKSLDPSGRVFPEMKKQHNKYSHHFSRFFLKLREGVGIKAPPRKKTYHSFRHTIATHLKAKDVQEHTIAELLGHTVSGMTVGRYGKKLEPRRLYELAVSLIDYPVSMEHLKGSRWTKSRQTQA